MLGIYIAAILTTGVAAAIFGPLIHKLKMPADRRLLWLAAAVALPMQPLAFYLVRIPLDDWLVAHLGSTSTTYQWLTSLYAPLTEEPAKLLPLLIPAIRHDIRATNFVRYALAIGVGFAIGEMWLVADHIARVPAFGLPFYMFGGYVGERLITCLLHSAFVCVALWRLRSRFLLGVAGAMTLHWLCNFPILLMAWDAGGFGKTFWTIAVQGWILLFFFGSLALVSYFTFGRVAPARIFYGRRRCPECDREYDPPMFLALNFGRTRYERCPHCRHWHWTKPQSAEERTEPLAE